MATKRQTSAARRRDKLFGLLIILAGFGGCMILSLWGLKEAMPKLAPAPAPYSKEGLADFPKKVDPFVILEKARKFSVRPLFRGFVARGVKRNGLIDLHRRKSDVRFSFQSEKGRDYQPLRKSGTLPERRFCGVQSVKLNKKGIVATKDEPERPCPRGVPVELGKPRSCTIADVWKLAIKNRIRKRGLAHVEYFEAKSGPAYRFKKDGRTLIVSARTCKRIKGRGARGLVP